jgi:glucose/mannose transport system substrate-binding protein
MPPAGWVLALVAFETMMPAVNGGDFYLDFMHGKADLTSGELEKLAAEFSKVIDCSNVAADDASPRWDATADLVVAGKATTFVMGDWAKGYFQGATDFEGNARDAWVPGTDFDVVPGLGSDGYFTFNSIVFGLPKGAAHPNAAAAFLGVVGSKDGQVASNSLKGSVPARKDVATDDFDSIVEGAIKDFQAAAAGTNKLLPGYASLTSYDFQVEINPTLLVFAVGGKKARALDPDNVPTDEAAIPAKDVDYLVNKIKANYDLLQ